MFTRGTRKNEITAAGSALRQAVLPALDGIDRVVRQIRASTGRRQVNLSTFASFTTLWLMPRLAGFQQLHPDIDIRITATDVLADLDDPGLDLVLRGDFAANLPPDAALLFGELLSPVASPFLTRQAASDQAPPLAAVAGLASHVLLEEDDHRPSASSLSWRRRLDPMGQRTLQPRRRTHLNCTHQQVRGVLAGQGVALAQLALVHEQLLRGELAEPFGPAGRLAAPGAYWLLPLPGARLRPELRAFIDWVRGEASVARAALGLPQGLPAPAPASPATDAGRASTP